MPRINETIKEISDIGWTGDDEKQGRECIAFTETEDETALKVRDLGERLKQRAIEKGLILKIEEDPFGNVYITLQGKSPRKVLICSHMDSVHRGGRYDGTAGIAGGLDALEGIIEDGRIPEKTIQLVAFRAEESSATQVACLGSSLASGQIPVETLQTIHHDIHQKDMLRIFTEDRGLSTDQLDGLVARPYIRGEDLDAVLELHIEQSGVLEQLGKPLGFVSKGIGGALRRKMQIGEAGTQAEIPTRAKMIRLTVKGVANHSGGTPMNNEKISGEKVSLRRDALTAMAKILCEISPKYLTEITVPGGSVNTVPGECLAEFYVPEQFDTSTIDAKIKTHLLEGMTAKAIEVTPETRSINAIREEVADTVMSIIKSTETTAEKMAQDTNGLVRATISQVAIQPQGMVDIWVDERRLDNFQGDILNSVLNRAFKVISRKRRIPVVEKTNQLERRKLSLATLFENRDIEALIKETYEAIFGEEMVGFGSMPGHDAAKMCRSNKNGPKVPTGVIFIRGANQGRSHHPSEYSSPEDLAKGSKLLCEVVKRLAYPKGPKAVDLAA
jgi:acetylornithine deacetylase/succinyl-diaminopimelate desuccinylase-like protein